MRTYKLSIENKKELFRVNNISSLKLTFEVKNMNDEDFLDLIEELKK